MANDRIKIAMAKNNIKQWELAELMGISEFTLCRKLRHELTNIEKGKILELINQKKKEEENSK